jgi:hypothetical protein
MKILGGAYKGEDVYDRHNRLIYRQPIMAICIEKNKHGGTCRGQIFPADGVACLRTKKHART